MSMATVIDRSSPESRKRTAAFLASVLIHLLVILLIGFILAFRVPLVAPEETEDTVELTLIDPPAPAKQEPAYIDSTVMQEAEKPPENPAFESDKNTAAGANLPATGDAPLPTLEGEESKNIELANRQYVAGREPRPASPPSAPSQPVESAPPPQPKATPEEQATPEPLPTPRATAQLALLEPPKQQQTQPRPTPQRVVQDARPPQPQSQPAPPSAPGYQPQTKITRIRGNISNRGRPSLAAASTPMGRYKKMLSDAIGSRWYYYVNEQMSLLNVGTLEMRFIVRENGKVENVTVVSNTSNETFASCSVRAIVEAEIPPIPKELVPMLEGNRIEIEYSFTILSR